MLSTFERESAWLKPVPKLEGKTLMEHLYARMDGLPRQVEIQLCGRGSHVELGAGLGRSIR